MLFFLGAKTLRFWQCNIRARKQKTFAVTLRSDRLSIIQRKSEADASEKWKIQATTPGLSRMPAVSA